MINLPHPAPPPLKKREIRYTDESDKSFSLRWVRDTVNHWNSKYPFASIFPHSPATRKEKKRDNKETKKLN